MKTLIKSVIIQALVLLLSVSPAFAQDRSGYAQQELDQMLAPIALYPDALLSQILMASTYPLEVVQAARWSRAHPRLKGQDAVRAVEDKDWEPSVKSLVAFPEILAMMDRKLDWTERLGDAFLAQQEQVMDTVQDLRRRAEAAGNLRSDDRVRVLRQSEIIIIEPVDPHIVYVPYYNPVIVYGPWWWPTHPPVYWAPWPGYHAAPAYVSGYYWGSGITISTGFFFGAFDWHHRHVKVVHVDHYRSHTQVSRIATIRHDRPGVWRHDPGHRRGTPYRHAALREETRSPSRIDARRDIQEHNAAPAARQEEIRRPGFRRDADHPGRRAEPKTSPDPRVEKRESEREKPGANRPGREFRELREPRSAQRERPGMQGNGRPESRREDVRRQRNVEPRPSAAPTVQQSRPAETQKPQPPIQRFRKREEREERGQRQSMDNSETIRRPPAGNHPPRARGRGETKPPDGAASRRQSTPAAGRPAPGRPPWAKSSPAPDRS